MKENGQTTSPWLTPFIFPKVGEIKKKKNNNSFKTTKNFF